MGLKDYYNDVKKTGQKVSLPVWILAIGITVGVIATYFYAIWAGWNGIIAKVFNLPSMTYPQMVGIIIWGFLVKILLTIGIRNEKDRPRN